MFTSDYQCSNEISTLNSKQSITHLKDMKDNNFNNEFDINDQKNSNYTYISYENEQTCNISIDTCQYNKHRMNDYSKKRQQDEFHNQLNFDGSHITNYNDSSVQQACTENDIYLNAVGDEMYRDSVLSKYQLNKNLSFNKCQPTEAYYDSSYTPLLVSRPSHNAYPQEHNQNYAGNCYSQQVGQPPNSQYWTNDNWYVEPDKLITPDLEVAIRNQFIWKVYMLISLQLCFTFVVSILSSIKNPMTKAIFDSSFFYIFAIAAMIGSFVGICVLTYIPRLARKVPYNYIILGIITLGMSIITGSIAASASASAVIFASGTTLGLTLILSFFAAFTKIDFTKFYIYLFVAALGLSVFGITMIFIKNKTAELVYACLSALLYMFYLVFDTQRIFGGKHRKFQFSIDDYVFAALVVYLDIIYIFLELLRVYELSEEHADNN